MARSNILTPNIPPMSQRCGLAALSVALALESARFLVHRHFEEVEFRAFWAIVNAAPQGSVRK